MFYWFEPVLYLDPISKFLETTERSGYFVGFADNIGDARKFKILKHYLVTVLHKSVVRSATDVYHRIKRVSFKSDLHGKNLIIDKSLFGYMVYRLLLLDFTST
jgi:hypothetical protein